MYNGIQVLGEITWASRDYHTVELAPVVMDILDRAQVLPSALEVVAVATGPGSYTGLRIGLALAKGMALARRLDLIGVPTLDVLVAAQPLVNLPLVAVLRAGRGKLAVGWYQPARKEWKATGKLEVMTCERLAERIDTPSLVCGELSEEERRLLSRRRRMVTLATPARSLRRPSFLAEIAWKRWMAGQRDDPAVLAPIYLHQQEPV
jgi:tRNA threonylcarbamoyladenosine biosynthesis protein TsaB